MRVLGKRGEPSHGHGAEYHAIIVIIEPRLPYGNEDIAILLQAQRLPVELYVQVPGAHRDGVHDQVVNLPDVGSRRISYRPAPRVRSSVGYIEAIDLAECG